MTGTSLQVVDGDHIRGPNEAPVNLATSRGAMFDQLVWWARALAAARATDSTVDSVAASVVDSIAD